MKPYLLALLVVIASAHADGEGDWSSYNRTLASNRFAPQSEIGVATVRGLRPLCWYRLDRPASFQTGPIVVDGVIYITSTYETAALDADTCAVKWHVTESYQPAMPLDVNRGAVIAHGKLIRGTQDGRVLAYDTSSGHRSWVVSIADPHRGETVPAAPIYWHGLVFVGNASGDYKGVKGRMYALDPESGRVVWEQYLVPRTTDDTARGPAAPAPVFPAGAWANGRGVPISGGATWTSYSIDESTGLLYVPAGNPAPDFNSALRSGGNPFSGSVVVLEAATGAVRHVYPLVTQDFHDYDVSAAPTLITTPHGHHLAAVAIKDGHIYGIDVDRGRVIWRVATTTIKNDKKSLSTQPVRFCPGTSGGTEWNGPAYSPQTRLLYVGSVDWCASIALATNDETRQVQTGQPWSGAASKTHPFGTFDPASQARGWLLALEPDSGRVVWRRHFSAPILSGVTSTAGGLVFAGDTDGRLYALDATSGAVEWSTQTPGGIGGGIVSYVGHQGQQRLAVATGMTSPLWSTPKALPTLVIYGLPGSSSYP
jgi:alcohol dehydrogenase (cytochrome c)